MRNVTFAMRAMSVTHLATYTCKLRKAKAQVHLSTSTFVLTILRHLRNLVVILAFLKKCKSKFDCLLVFEMLFTNELRLVSIYNQTHFV